ncbi:Serine carboxypeptidase-like 2 [Linum perenne]
MGKPGIPCIQLLALVLVFMAYESTATVIKYLPGFEGPLPFYLETGYIGVGVAEEVQLFYYFVKSESNPEEDPLLLWITGGPGCSALSGLTLENGPFTFNEWEYSGTLPKLSLKPNSWTKLSSIIFLDLPVGTGFSYTRNDSVLQSTDLMQVSQAEEFLRRVSLLHANIFSFGSRLMIGNSYLFTCSVPVKKTVAKQTQGIPEESTLHRGRFLLGHYNSSHSPTGYILGNPTTDYAIHLNAQIPAAHGMALISDELYQCLSGINVWAILAPNCLAADKTRRRMLLQKQHYYYDSDSQLSLPNWANDVTVRKALHIREGTIGKWIRCNLGLDNKHDITSSFPYHLHLSAKGYRSLIYNGDHDLMVPFMGTQAWIRALNYSIVEDWRSWHVGGQVAGYTRTYSNGMTYATVKGGAHVALEDKPAECFAMFERWIHHEPL